MKEDIINYRRWNMAKEKGKGSNVPPTEGRIENLPSREVNPSGMTVIQASALKLSSGGKK